MTPTTPPLDHSLERAVVISARREMVFGYFIDNIRFAAWWGAGSSVDARPGGVVRIRYPNGVVASGEVVELEAPRRIAFSYGYEDPAKGLPPGGSRVTVTLEEVAAGGTLLRLRQDLPDAAARDAHAPGWRFQLSLLANVAAREAHADAGTVIGRFFSAWNTPDAAARQATLATAVTADVTFRDPYAAVTGLDDLAAHIAAVHTFMPGLALTPAGEARQCQGTALCEWVARGADGAARGAGTNVFTLAPDGRIAACVGFWNG
jgi:uncharacterized protein YndB with AHSA1/START domain